jgi:hypothetical protein
MTYHLEHAMSPRPTRNPVEDTRLQRAKAAYEEARIEYRRAVLASLDEPSRRGDDIQKAIRRFQQARGDLERLDSTRRARPEKKVEEAGLAAVVSMFWRLLRAS